MFGYTQGDGHGIQIDVTRRQRRAERNNQERHARALLQGAQAAEGGYGVKTSEQYRRLEATTANQQERIVTLEARCAAAERERDDYLAVVGQMSEALRSIEEDGQWSPCNNYWQPSTEATNKAFEAQLAVPTVSLANLKADAVDLAIDHNKTTAEISGDTEVICYVEDLQDTSNTLRNQAKDESNG